MLFGIQGSIENRRPFSGRKERFKKNAVLGQAFYENIGAHAAKAESLIWETIDNTDERTGIEVVNLWVDAINLAGLVTLSNYDRPNNENVDIPFASGCQSIWSPFTPQPYGQQLNSGR